MCFRRDNAQKNEEKQRWRNRGKYRNRRLRRDYFAAKECRHRFQTAFTFDPTPDKFQRDSRNEERHPVNVVNQRDFSDARESRVNATHGRGWRAEAAMLMHYFNYEIHRDWRNVTTIKVNNPYFIIVAPNATKR